MDQVVLRKSLLNPIEPCYPIAGRGRQPYPLETMPRVPLMQNRFGLSDPAMEEALYAITPMRAFAGLTLTKAIPDETTILDFRHRWRRTGSRRRSCLGSTRTCRARG
jgi:IS5 family transposase